jgi:hypothetical protein
MWGEKGLESYKIGGIHRMKIASWDLIPGVDAVARAVNAIGLISTGPVRSTEPEFISN